MLPRERRKIDFPPSSCWAIFHVDDSRGACSPVGRPASIDRSQVMLRPYGRIGLHTAVAASDDSLSGC